MPASQQFPVDPDVLDEIADRLSDAIVERVIEAIRAEGVPPAPGARMTWLDAQEVAHRLGVSREWVYEHADRTTRLENRDRATTAATVPTSGPGCQGKQAHNSRSRQATNEAAVQAQRLDSYPPI